MSFFDKVIGRLSAGEPARSGAFTIHPGEALPGRPQTLRRLTFEDHWLFGVGRWESNVVPIEHVRPGDEQVAVWGRGLQYREPTIHDLDLLADFPGVVSVLGAGSVRLRTPLPHVRELFASPLDEETLHNLPNLEQLVGGRAHKERFLDPESAPPRLRDLIGSPFGRLDHLKNLERLQTGTHFRESAEQIAGLNRLRWLDCVFGKGLRHLGKLTELELLEIDVQEGPALSNLEVFAGLEKLRFLHVNGRRLRSLDGIERLRALEYLYLYRPGVSDIAPIAGLPRLSRVRLEGADRVLDFSPLRDLPVLEWAHVLFHDHCDLPQPDLPGVALHWLKPWQRRADIEVGEIAIVRLEDGTWSIFQDVTDLLGVQTNHEAEDRVRAAMDPALRERVEFDSEGSALAISAASETDIRAAALAVLSLRVE